jgi:hypothetical protein
MDDNRFSLYIVSKKYGMNTDLKNYICWKNWHCLSAFYDYLMAIDIHDFDWISKRPINKEYKKIQINLPYLLWLRDDIDNIFNKTDSKTHKIRANIFLKLYINYREYNNYEHNNITPQVFNRFITDIIGIEKGEYDRYGANFILSKNKIKEYLTEKRMYDNFKKPIKMKMLIYLSDSKILLIMKIKKLKLI